MTSAVDYREYENGVADVLRFVAGDGAEVRRDVRIGGRRSGTDRQVDVLVRGILFGFPDATLAVDCKRWKKKLDVADVEAFIAVLDDLGVDLGMLMTTEGYTPAAKTRARNERGVRTEVLTLGELEQWCPRGTVHVGFRLPRDRSEDARAALVRAGLRVRVDRGLEQGDDQMVLEAYSYAAADAEPKLGEVAEAALTEAGLPVDIAASGTTVGGGTPAHRWLEVSDGGRPTGLKICVASQADVDQELGRLATELAVAPQSLDVFRPSDWPVSGLFGLPAAAR